VLEVPLISVGGRKSKVGSENSAAFTAEDGEGEGKTAAVEGRESEVEGEEEPRRLTARRVRPSSGIRMGTLNVFEALSLR
jgi:hypothetical protein